MSESTNNTAHPKPKKSTPKRRSPLRVTIAVVAVLIAAFVGASQVYTDWLWFDQLGYSTVFTTQILLKVAVFVVAAVVIAVPLWASMSYAVRHADVARASEKEPQEGPNSNQSVPTSGTDAAEQMLRDVFGQQRAEESMRRYHESVDKARKVLLIVVPLLLGLFIASATMTQWSTVALFFNQQSFGKTDPEFGLDYGFFLFALPFFRMVVTLVTSAVVLSALAGLFMHYFYGGIKVQPGGVSTTSAFRRHAAIVVAAFLLTRAVSFWLDRYSSTQQQVGRWAGAMYTDVNSSIPVNAILAISALLVAIMFVVAASMNRWRLPLISTAMLVIVAVVAGGLYPWIVQRFQVVPNEQGAQSKFIQRNIDATRYAYGLDKIETTPYDATIDTRAGALSSSSATIANIRLLDPNVVSSAFAQMQQFRPYYRFDSQLSVDRYSVGNTTQDTVLAARELNPAQTSGDSWYNRHVVYTHGYGVIAAYGNQVDSAGNPKFLQSGIKATGSLSEDYEPRIYFGMSSPEYSIVGGKGDTLELDRPLSAEETNTSDAKYTFAGYGGPRVDSLLARLSYAIKFQSSDILLSDAVREGSQILYERNPLDRVRKVAPYLSVDSKPYPAIVNNRVQWIVDAYTTSDQFPYAQGSSQDAATAAGAQRSNSVNYIRNSVKATVDAYDGSVTLYAWDEEDPVLKTWQGVFPGTVKSYREMNASLMSHVRYPTDMFNIQRTMLNKYHVTNANSFYAGDDVWSIPNDPTNDRNQPISPYYLSLQMPGDSRAHFSLTTTFIPQQSDSNSRNVMYGFLAANGDAGTGKDGERSPDYGKLRLLELPRSSVVPGPGQAQNIFNSDAEVSNQLNLLRRGSSEVINGNMLTLPVGGGMLYVQPVYVQSSGDAKYPRLQRVLVSFGDKVGFAPTLEEALNQVFGGSSGAKLDGSAASPSASGSSGTSGTSGALDTSTGGSSASQSSELKQALTDASKAMTDADAAMKKGDWAAYGEAQKRLEAAVKKALEAEEAQSAASAKASASVAPSASAAPSAAASAKPSASGSR